MVDFVLKGFRNDNVFATSGSRLKYHLYMGAKPIIRSKNDPEHATRLRGTFLARSDLQHATINVARIMLHNLQDSLIWIRGALASGNVTWGFCPRPLEQSTQSTGHVIRQWLPI
jgi:hypothetical protein